MLQCTAVTPVPPPAELTAVLATMKGGPDHPQDALPRDRFLLCELGEHDEHTEHAALLWAPETPTASALWFFWDGTGAHRVHRVGTVPWCPAVLRVFATASVLPCSFFQDHVASHSWGVTDPLGELIAGPITSGESDEP
ncbi:hypothetical protein [Streptomyces sp. NPDC059452]|uniref:hypothetical protein n=1 Tax=Streptomyces sp. NPDC059452 TaxID=3346835 RepID=UPI0036BD17AA